MDACSEMAVKTYQIAVHGVFDTNCFIHADEESGHCFLIDPGAEAMRLITIIHDHALTVERVLLTHGHFDHIGAVEKICSTLGVPFSIHREGRAYLESPALNLSAHYEPITLAGADLFEDGVTFTLEANPKISLRAIHTPGHTPDSVAFLDPVVGKAFVGDTIFQGGIGTWEYPGGNRDQLVESIYRILDLPAETKLLSGHSNPWTVGEARARLFGE